MSSASRRNDPPAHSRCARSTSTSVGQSRKALRLAEHGKHDVVLIQEPCRGNGEKNFIPQNLNCRTFSRATHWSKEKVKVARMSHLPTQSLESGDDSYCRRLILLAVRVDGTTVINMNNHTDRGQLQWEIFQAYKQKSIKLKQANTRYSIPSSDY